MPHDKLKLKLSKKVACGELKFNFGEDLVGEKARAHGAVCSRVKFLPSKYIARIVLVQHPLFCRTAGNFLGVRSLLPQAKRPSNFSEERRKEFRLLKYKIQKGALTS